MKDQIAKRRIKIDFTCLPYFAGPSVQSFQRRLADSALGMKTFALQKTKLFPFLRHPFKREGGNNELDQK